MKVIIIGFGKMGNSHFNSFLASRRNYKIDIVDINKTVINKKNVYFHLKIPKFKEYDLAIISTGSRERLKIIKELLKYNKVKFLLLEKIVFSKSDEYYKAFKIFNKYKTKVMVNTWGQLLAKKFSKIINKEDKVYFNFINSEGNLIANLPHFLEFIKFFHSKNLKITIGQIDKMIHSKWKGYNEILGNIIVKNKYLNANILTKKGLNNRNENIIIEMSINADNFKFVLLKNSKCMVYKNNKVIQSYLFPFFAFKITEKLFYKDFINYKKGRKLFYFNNFKSNSKTSIKIINLLKNKYKRQILIT